MRHVIDELYEVILDRKANPAEGSYTSYLFAQGLDKILKKCGEESSELIIAAKNSGIDEMKEEICDVAYHILVLMALAGIRPEEIASLLDQRRLKVGNLKPARQTDKDS